MNKQTFKISILLFAASLLLAWPAHAVSFKDCQELLSRAMAPVQKVISQITQKKEVIPETPADNFEDYKPEGFEQLSLADQFIETQNRIRNRNHKSTKTAFFYDYEVRDTIEKMKSILAKAKDFSKAETRDQKQHAGALVRLHAEILKYENAKRVSYLEFHETTLLFTAFQKQGLEGIQQFQMKPLGRYSQKDYVWSYHEMKYHIKPSGFNDIERQELGWGMYRSKLLRDSRLVFIPTFNELDEDFFNKISPYPVFPAGMTEHPHIVADGQLFGPVMFILHDFYHAYWAAKSVDYSPEAIEARVQRYNSFMQGVSEIKDPELNRIIRVLFNFMTHEEIQNVLNETVVASLSSHIASLLKLDGSRLTDFQERVYSRPYDFGEMFGDEAPDINKVYEARQWLSDFFKADTFYP